MSIYSIRYRHSIFTCVLYVPDTIERGRERQRATATLTTAQILQQLLRTVLLSRVSTSETEKWTGVGLHETDMLQKAASHRSKVESKLLQET